MSRDLVLPPELEWLRYLLMRSGEAVPPLIEAAWRREYLAEYLLGLYESLDHVLLLEYYVLFLRDESFLAPERADELDARRAELQRVILERSAALRDTWRATYVPPADDTARAAAIAGLGDLED